MSGPPRRRPVLLVVSAVGLAAFLGLSIATRPVEVVPPGVFKQWDDSRFAVNGPRRLARIEGVGPRVVVRFEVANVARRVDFRFDPARLSIEDDRGRRYGLDATATARLNGRADLEATIPAGSSIAMDLAFDVPPDAEDLRLGLSTGKIGDAIDWLTAGITRFALVE